MPAARDDEALPGERRSPRTARPLHGPDVRSGRRPSGRPAAA
ncbi:MULTISPECIES: hypothetical protein [unclassified Streptomyces]|nr:MULTISPECIES: hypothetical protein [unclassified Streptomyces]